MSWRLTLGTVRQWHWMSSALCLVGMLLFAVTGITLNHAADIRVSPQVDTYEIVLPDTLLASLATADTAATLPEPIQSWLQRELGVRASGPAEWDATEVYVSLPRPGGDGWLVIERDSGTVFYESTDRGWIAYLNDLHKGRNTGLAWSWFIDIFSLACVVFCLTGLLLLYRHAGGRPTTWPLVGLGLLIPWLLALLFIH